jgi:hypothetical protein
MGYVGQLTQLKSFCQDLDGFATMVKGKQLGEGDRGETAG